MYKTTNSTLSVIIKAASRGLSNLSVKFIMLDVIDTYVKRSDYDTELGIYKQAEISFSQADYKLVYLKEEHRTLIYKRNKCESDYHEVKWGWSNNCTYCVTSINGCMLYAHQLLLVCFRPNLYMKYRQLKTVINHMLVESCSRDCGRYRIREKPMTGFETDPMYLEVITQGENRFHGKCVNDLGLWGIAVSYKDSVMLYEKFNNGELSQDEILDEVLAIYKARGTLDFHNKRELLYA